MEQDFKAPVIESLKTITPEQMAEYIRYVELMRHNQRRWYKTHNPEALRTSMKLEQQIDELNQRLLHPLPTLFDNYG